MNVIATLSRLQLILTRLEEARIQQKSSIITNDRAAENLIQTLEKVDICKNSENNEHLHNNKPKNTVLGYGATETKIVKNKHMWAKAARLVPPITGTLLIYTCRGVMGH